jgi:phosphate transport system substrate-binding protein
MRTSANSSEPWKIASIVLFLVLTMGSYVRAAEVIRVAGSSSALGTIQLLANAFSRNSPNVTISVFPSLASEGGKKALSSGAIDIAVVSRPLNAGEIKTGLSQIEYARTPFVFAISERTKVHAITGQELADIYSGKMEKWPDGTRARIVLRPEGNPNDELVKKLSVEVEKGVLAAKKRPGMKVVLTDEEAADWAERVPGTIGTVSLALIVSERRPLKALALDGVTPTPSNAATRTYPLHKPLFLVTATKRSAVTDKFVAFVRSPAGRAILTENGHWIP